MPSEYVAKLERGNDKNLPIESAKLDTILKSHLIGSKFLGAESFDAFMEDRQARLLALIEQEAGKAAYTGNAKEEGEDVEGDEAAVESEKIIAA